MNRDLVTAIEGGGFLEFVSNLELQTEESRRLLANDLVELHNAGTIDILSISWPKVPYFLGLVPGEALPRLNSPVRNIMSFVTVWYSEALSQPGPAVCDPFVSFLRADPTRVRDALVLCFEDATLASLLTDVLIAGEIYDQAMDLSSDARPEVAQRAIRALGGIRLEVAQAREAIERIDAATGDQVPDLVRAAGLASLLDIWKAHPDLESSVCTAYAKLLACPGPMLLAVACRCFSLFSGEISAELLAAQVKDLLPHWLQVCAADRQTVASAFYSLLDTHRTLAVAGIEMLVEVHLSDELLELLSSEFYKIGTVPELLNEIATRWLSVGGLRQCSVLVFIVRNHANGSEIAIDASLRAGLGVSRGLVARRAVGWLSSAPKTAASIVLSLLGDTEQEAEKEELRALLVDLLLSVPGQLSEYYVARMESAVGPVRPMLDGILEEYKRYDNAIRSTLPKLALRPSTANQNIAWDINNEVFSASYKEGRKRSALLQLGKERLVLHGRRTVEQMHTLMGAGPRIGVSMEKFEASMEFSRFGFFDPVGEGLRMKSLRGSK